MDQASGAESSPITFQDLPIHLQHHIFASAAAPLTTCKASAAITSDASLVATWLLTKHHEPLRRAAKHRLWDVCVLLLETHKHVPTKAERELVLPHCAKYGQTSLVHSLLQWPCEEPFNSTGWCRNCLRAVCAAAYGGQASACSLIIQRRHDMSVMAQYAICAAARYGQLGLLQLLLDTYPAAAKQAALNDMPGRFKGPGSMSSAAMAGHVSAMQLLLQHNQDTGSNTYASPAALKNAMCSAAQNEHLEAVRWLLDHGADASQALTACTETGHADILRLLLSRGADLHPDGPSQLTFVLLYKAPEVAQLLLEMGVPTNTTVLQRLERLQQKGTLCTHVSRISRHQSSALLEAAVRHGHTEFAQLWGQAHAAVHGGDSVAGQLEAS